jgi:hypothetical protein
LLYGTKPFDSLQVQRDTIEAELETVRWQPGKAVALIPPHEYTGDILWFTFPCRLQQDNEQFMNPLMVREADLRRLLTEVHAAAAPV